jgi:hypothetical protein
VRVIVALLFAAAACGGSAKSAPPPPAPSNTAPASSSAEPPPQEVAPRPDDQAIADLEVLTKRACECGDTPCAEAVQKDFDLFLEKYKDTKGSQEQAEHVGKLAGQMAECLANAMQPQP